MRMNWYSLEAVHPQMPDCYNESGMDEPRCGALSTRPTQGAPMQCTHEDGCDREAKAKGQCMKHYMRGRYKQTRHGISADQKIELLNQQGGVCAICGTDSPGANGWEVDHDHECCAGKNSCGNCIRGLLCLNCNSGISRFEDSPALLGQAILYLRRHGR